MQQQMMTYMTVFMGVMFYKVPAGLCIYFITSSLWGICERKLLPKPAPKPGDVTTSRPSGSNGWGNPGAGKRPKQRK
jgi:YidC/Oxa1 family membrane protein insertase